MASKARVGLGRGEPIKVVATGHDGYPSHFTFRGRRYRVRSAETRPAPARALNYPTNFEAQWMEVRTESGLRALLSRSGGASGWRMESILQ